MVLDFNINPTYARTLLDAYYCNELNFYNVYILKLIFETYIILKIHRKRTSNFLSMENF